MYQLLPYDFRWVDDVENFMIIVTDSFTDYILEVDLKYPQHFYDAHTDLSFCSIREKPFDKQKKKLLTMLYDKKCYVIHYRNL